MTKLNTLKDLDPQPCCMGYDRKDLREEAIKWVKKLDKTEACEGIREWIKCFFNLTEDDLK